MLKIQHGFSSNIILHHVEGGGGYQSNGKNRVMAMTSVNIRGCTSRQEPFGKQNKLKKNMDDVCCYFYHMNTFGKDWNTSLCSDIISYVE